ncbi:MAG TPA: hypothetical protein VKN36_13895 [Eudoraea sp.]|nr:hypothetical protein [Eudoraea sp.]
MKVRNYFLVISLLNSFIYSVSVQSQGTLEMEKFYQWFDQSIGVENTGLYDGIIYIDTYRTINEKTKFYSSPRFLPGSVVYDGQPYSDLEVKYNVFDDELLVRLPDRLGGVTLQLFKDKVSDFVIDGHLFINLNNIPPETGMNGFYEITFRDSQLTLLTKHLKKDYARKDRRNLYYEFLDIKKEHVLFYNGAYYVIKSKKDLISLFPELKNEIDSFYKVARSLRNSDNDAFMQTLVKRMASLLNSRSSNDAVR